MIMWWERIYNNAFLGHLKATIVDALDGGGPKDSENTLNSFLTKYDNDMFWQIGADMFINFRFHFADDIHQEMCCHQLWPESQQQLKLQEPHGQALQTSLL